MILRGQPRFIMFKDGREDSHISRDRNKKPFFTCFGRCSYELLSESRNHKTRECWYDVKDMRVEREREQGQTLPIQQSCSHFIVSGDKEEIARARRNKNDSKQPSKGIKARGCEAVAKCVVTWGVWRCCHWRFAMTREVLRYA